MSDPVTVGSLVVSVLAKAADAGLSAVAKSAAGDAYEKLKQKVSQWAATKVATLEVAPDSERTRRDIAEIIDRQSEHEVAAIRLLAQRLGNELKNSGLAVGLELLDLKNVTIALENIEATGNSIGARVQRLEGGHIEAKDIKAKGRAPK